MQHRGYKNNIVVDGTMQRYETKKELFLVLKCRADTKKNSCSLFCIVLLQTAHSRKYYLLKAQIKLMCSTTSISTSRKR